ncbi:MAG: type I restriction enzyme HsdR N-terminal domain-containing protein [Bacteroidia bacterium]|nr:type I restriction enzyme HsdR N-terminal domain-containing protein [Bacteroidia bacterium]
MYQLNLPIFNVKIQRKNEKTYIFDFLRKKYVALTPEEWVRQHFTHYLVNDLNYPSGLLANETQIRVGNTVKRCDTVLYNNSLQALMIVEYKAPNVDISQRVFDQISRYNMVLHVDYLTVSNGLQHYCCKMDYENHTYKFLQHIPCFQEL